MVRLEWENKEKISENLENLINNSEYKFEKIKDPLGIRISESLNQGKNSDSWRNKLFWDDNLSVLCYLLKKNIGQIDLIYIDPPFFSGSDYIIKIEDSKGSSDSLAYKDRWSNNFDAYLQMLYERLFLIKQLLSNRGLLFVHLDWHASHYVKTILDELFENRFVNNIVWYYYNKYSSGKKILPRAHDDILVYSKSDNYTFNEIREPRKRPRKQLKRTNVNGVLKNAKDKNGKVIYRVVKDKKIDDVWKIPCMQPASKEWTGYPTQKHHELLERIVKLGSNEGDLIADFFCGSGTTLLAAEKLNRRWIGCDNNKYSIHIILKRLDTFQKDLNAHPYDLFTRMTQEKKEVLKTGFFAEEILIKSKK
ncbi:MAG: site-specific DNA-methyltransferase [Candidatus Lokiarchaeota archaeon]|nr:site-specific DNA-methyltransferase [Candidatus Lokiarchaeota archaeon]